MEHTVHELSDGRYYRFHTDKGTVWARVQVEDARTKTVSLAVYEQESAIAAIGMDDEEARELRITTAQRNRFGTGLMLRILRTVRESIPEARRWVYERKAGANEGRIHERVF